MAMTSVFAIAAIVGDGSASNPRRATMWGRLDNVLSVIKTGNYCLKPDGTVDTALISQINVSMSIAHDFGPCGVTHQSMDSDAWNAIRAHLLSEKGYVVWGRTIPELKKSIQEATAIIQANMALAGFTLPVQGATTFDKVNTYFTATRFATDFVGGGMLLVRAYYQRRLAGATAELPDLLGRANGTLDPTRFETLRSTIDGASKTDMRRMCHELYDLACFDLVLRSLP